jgi:hypothetical protein
MRKAFLFTLLAAASFSLAAQQQKDPHSSDKQQEKPVAEERTRIEGAAGGTSPVPDEKRKAVGAGAGPHLKDNLPSPQKLPRDKPVEPSK